MAYFFFWKVLGSENLIVASSIAFFPQVSSSIQCPYQHLVKFELPIYIKTFFTQSADDQPITVVVINKHISLISEI